MCHQQGELPPRATSVTVLRSEIAISLQCPSKEIVTTINQVKWNWPISMDIGIVNIKVLG
jgi:hypothetical protein